MAICESFTLSFVIKVRANQISQMKENCNLCAFCSQVECKNLTYKSRVSQCEKTSSSCPETESCCGYHRCFAIHIDNLAGLRLPLFATSTQEWPRQCAEVWSVPYFAKLRLICVALSSQLGLKVGLVRATKRNKSALPGAPLPCQRSVLNLSFVRRSEFLCCLFLKALGRRAVRL